MGYTTDFRGQFDLNKPLDDKTYTFLKGLNETRRMARLVPSEFGVDGEFYIEGTGNFGQGQDKNIIDYNKPPRTQPSLWCQWMPTEDRKSIVWDEGEKFYNYVEWIQYILNKILIPRGYTLQGNVEWVGEDSFDDRGVIKILHDNSINIERRVSPDLS